MIDSFTHVISNAKQNGKLIFKNLGVKTIPKSNLTISFNDINYIDISENKFTAIPEIISEFQCLEILFCSHNNIRSLSSNINNLIYLETLDLSCNHLTSVHSAICKLECLKILLLSSNRLVALPKGIGALSRLEELDASCNSLTCVPDELAMLRQLRFLNLRHNKLLDVPIGLSTLSLEILDLSENQLSSIPIEYHRIETLQSFNLSGNPLTFPPANVTNRGLLHIMKYLQSEFRRQNQRQHGTKMESHGNIECSTLNDTTKSESINYETNPDDSVKSTSTSFPSVVDLEQDYDNGCQDFPKYKYLPQMELVNSFSHRDSGYNTISHSLKLNRIDKYHQVDMGKSLEMSNSIVDHGHHDENPCSLSYRDGLLKTSERLAERQFKKNKNYTSTTNSISQMVSPQTYRSTRFNSRNRVLDPNKIRRNSLPDNDYAAQANNFTNHDIEVSSECVVVVDNMNNEGLQPHSSQDKLLTAQSNNSNSNYSSLRAMKSRNYDSFTVRRNSSRTQDHERRIPELEVVAPQNPDMKLKNQESIKKFHKIIEAQLHVHIHSKDLSKELSNGIYLCHLAKYLIPNCIPIVHTPSPGQRELGKQKSKRNLDNFLETCRRNGVSEVKIIDLLCV